MAKMLDEVSRSISPASLRRCEEIPRTSQQPIEERRQAEWRQITRQLRQKELGKGHAAKWGTPRILAASVDALSRAEEAIAAKRNFVSHTKAPAAKASAPGRTTIRSFTPSKAPVCGTTPAANRPDQDPRGLAERGDPQLADGAAPTRLHGQVSPGDTMPSISLKGVSIKGQSGVAFEEAVQTAQSDAQNAAPARTQVPARPLPGAASKLLRRHKKIVGFHRLVYQGSSLVVHCTRLLFLLRRAEEK